MMQLLSHFVVIYHEMKCGNELHLPKEE